MKHTHGVLPLVAVCVLALLAGCATPAMRDNTANPAPIPEPRTALDTTTPLARERIAATSFIDADRGWAVGEVADGVGSLVQP